MSSPKDQPGPGSQEQPADPDEGGGPLVAPPATSGQSRVLLLAGIAIAVVIVDQVAKAIAVAKLTPGESPRILGGLIYFSLIRNPGAAFSMATGMTWILALVAIAVVVVIIRLAPRLRATPWAVALGLILGGAVGNLGDRIFRAPGPLRGWVVDFISVFGPDAKYFPVFNLADSAITIGAVTLVITALLGIDFDGRRGSSRGSAPGPSGGPSGGPSTGSESGPGSGGG